MVTEAQRIAQKDALSELRRIYRSALWRANEKSMPLGTAKAYKLIGAMGAVLEAYGQDTVILLYFGLRGTAHLPH